jgi:MerR family mercuric resistance operon transcriptional regulator
LVAHISEATSCGGSSIKRNFSISPVASTSPGAPSIGELSRRTGVNIEIIRYYERIKMLPAPPRTTSGRRVYGSVETRTLTFIRRSRERGFSLDQIRALLALSAKNGQAAGAVDGPIGWRCGN